MSKKQNIIIFDTTLRDGEQSPGASMSFDDKIAIALKLEELNVDVIEAGFAAASKEDFEIVSKISSIVKNSSICSLSRAVEKDIDLAALAVKASLNGRIHTFIATSDIHLKHKLNKNQEEIIEIIHSSVKYARNLCSNVEWSAEDATRTDINFLIKCVQTAINAGARTINLPDTVGFATPIEYKNMFEEVIKNTNYGSGDVIFSTHCHNDLGMATANALCGIQGGARQIECTINGIGERAGNTALEEIVMSLKTREELGFCTNINTTKIREASKLVSKATGFTIQPNKAIVGKNAFLHESGIHQDGILKNKNTYEIMDKNDIGLAVYPITLGRLSGRAALKEKLKEFACYPNDSELAVIFEKFKQIATTKKFILDADIIDIIGSQTSKKIAQSLEFVSYEITKIDKDINTKYVDLTCKFNESLIKAQGVGNGVIDAVFKAINQIVGIEPVLESFMIDAVSSGSDAIAMTSIVLNFNQKSFATSQCDNDITISATKSYITAINKILNDSLSSKFVGG
jgi:2-isopropylmalate synthase